MTEEDVEAELAVIHSQTAYVLQLQGRADEALQLYNQVIKLKWVSASSVSPAAFADVAALRASWLSVCRLAGRRTWGCWL